MFLVIVYIGCLLVSTIFLSCFHYYRDIGITVTDFGPSWRDGLAFLGIVDSIKSNLVSIPQLRHRNNRERLEAAFKAAEDGLGVTRLLDPEDVDVAKPDEKSIMTYVAQFLHMYPEPRAADGSKTLAACETEFGELRHFLHEKLRLLEDNRLPANGTYQVNFKFRVKALLDKTIRNGGFLAPTKHCKQEIYLNLIKLS